MQHKNIPDDGLHEPKGIVNAVPGTVYVSTGTQTGTWKKLGVDSLLGSINPSTPGLTLLTDGSGGFTAQSDNVFINLNGPVPVSPTFRPGGMWFNVINAVGESSGINVAGGQFLVTTPGLYQITTPNRLHRVCLYTSGQPLYTLNPTSHLFRLTPADSYILCSSEAGTEEEPFSVAEFTIVKVAP